VAINEPFLAHPTEGNSVACGDSDDRSYGNLARPRVAGFEFASKDARVNMRLPTDLLNAVKVTAALHGMPYQRFIRQALERALNG